MLTALVYVPPPSAAVCTSVMALVAAGPGMALVAGGVRAVLEVGGAVGNLTALYDTAVDLHARWTREAPEVPVPLSLFLSPARAPGSPLCALSPSLCACLCALAGASPLHMQALSDWMEHRMPRRLHVCKVE